MELKDFIAETLKQIIDGVKEAQIYASENGGIINPKGIVIFKESGNSTSYGRLYNGEPAQTIDFDIAVTTQDSIGVKGKIGVFVGAFKAGVEGNDNSVNSSLSKIKFHLPIFLPNQK